MEPVRTCVGCRKTGTRKTLIRLVSKNETLIVDDSKVLPGRGAWLHGNRECLKLALERKAFGRSLNQAITADADALTEQIVKAEMMLATNE